MKPVNKDETDTKVKSVLCFAVSPQMRGQGVATQLLKRVCEDAKEDGFDLIEAYPNREFTSTEDDFMGTISMFEKAGFIRCYEAGNKIIMQKALKV